MQGACTESLRLSVNKTRRKLGKREGALKEKEQEKYDRKTEINLDFFKILFKVLLTRATILNTCTYFFS